jgi:hypothetical protein
LICGAWISGLGEHMRGVCRCQEGYRNSLHRTFSYKGSQIPECISD